MDGDIGCGIPEAEVQPKAAVFQHKVPVPWCAVAEPLAVDVRDFLNFGISEFLNFRLSDFLHF